ncbi:glutathione S-transferase family protein [Saccharospirillum impatiens]|uniref:glutathione S-transferase family protein n=1 Tax=Saccharospirillum impatiens TaxID=169438 RepID=UPI0003FCE5A2|nr:glutathione S-transferase family protein [Saccharospirillum impatiens]
MSTDTLVFYHAPQTRGTGIWFLLEELGIPYEMKVLNHSKGDNRKPEFLAINPLGKFPTLVHNGQVITEQVACYTYLADRFPDKGLAPAFDDSLRGPYLRWMAFQGSSFEPALIDLAMKREPGDPSFMPYGSFEQMQDTLFNQIAGAPYLLGDRLYAVDIFWGTTLMWCRNFGLIETTAVVDDYIERIVSRPAFIEVTRREKALVDKLAAAVAEKA